MNINLFSSFYIVVVAKNDFEGFDPGVAVGPGTLLKSCTAPKG